MKPFLRTFWPYLAAMLSGILQTLLFPPYEWDFLAWLALIPLLCAAWFGKLTSLQRLLAGLLCGFFFFAATFSWLGKITPIGWLGLSVYLSIYPAIWVWLAGLPACRMILTKPAPGESPWRRSVASLAVAITLASTWSTLEWLRGWLFGGFSWNTLGVALNANIPFVQLASVGGVPFLSWLVVFSNVVAVTTICRLIIDAGRLTFASRSDFTVGLALVLSCFAYGLGLSSDRSTDRELKVSLVQAGATPERLESYLRLSSLALVQTPDLIVWPESAPGRALLDGLDDLQRAAAKYEIDLDSVHAWLITGSQEHSAEGSYNSAFAISPDLTSFQTYRKRHLLPFYESNFSSGKSSIPLWIVGTDARLGPLICIEDTVPPLARANVVNGANLLLNLTDDGLFADRVVERQHFLNSLFRAPETGLPLLRCAHTGVTAVTDRHGRVLQALQPSNPGILTAKIPYRSRPQRTFFSRYPLLFPSIWISLVIFRFLLFRRGDKVLASP